MALIGTDINKAVELLQEGKLVAIPTETVYGLAGNALNEDAVLKIFEAKNRPSFDPLIVHVGNLYDLDKYIIKPGLDLDFLNLAWPGSLTVIFDKKTLIPHLVTSGLSTVGIRMPDHPLTLELLNSIRFPLAAPSANPFGYVSPTTAQHVNQYLGDKIDYILDGGPCKVGIESTIMGFEDEEPRVYRLGGMDIEKLKHYLKTDNLKIELNKSSDPVAPGMLKSHYAPSKPFFLYSDYKLFSTSFDGKKAAYITFEDSIEEHQNSYNFVLSPLGDMKEAARNLFKIMREADESDCDVILAEEVPENGLGLAINDRLRRASVKG
ncbi:MAG: L-threonylcarbamoyladenylate synthase [Bacteroidota bacterium]